MIKQTDTQIQVEQVVGRSAPELFAVLADPERHVDIDGSGMLRADVDTRPITAVGEVFTMEMHHPALGDYRTDNHVVELEPGRRVAWLTARAGQTPPGVRWTWELRPLDADHTTVVHTYDWSQVTDPAILARVSFPRVSAEALEQSVQRLAAAAG